MPEQKLAQALQITNIVKGGLSTISKIPMHYSDDIPETDRELERRVTSFLEAKYVPALRYLEVKARRGVVTLTGRVYTFYEKQLCNQCCRRVPGVQQLVNDVDVIGTMPGAAVVA